MTTQPLSLRDPSADPTFTYESSPNLYLFTSLTAGSSHIITATSRLETILKANRVPFLAVDCATDEKARRIWSRRAGKRKLPGLVKEGMVLADLDVVEEWNEFGEIRENLGGEGRMPVAMKLQASQAGGGAGGASSTASVPAKGTAAPPPAAKQTAAAASPQTQGQSSLAAEAAAAGALRNKTKPATSSTKTPASATRTEDAKEDTTPPPPTKPTSPSPAQSPRRPEEEEIAAQFSDTAGEQKHNTSAQAGLPPLSLRTKSPSVSKSAEPAVTAGDAADEGEDGGEKEKGIGKGAHGDIVNRGREASIAYPPAPPSTAIDSTPPSGSLSRSNDGMDLPASIPEEGAAPASKTGLNAVTSDPEGMAEAMGKSKNKDVEGRESDVGLSVAGDHSPADGETKRHRHSSITEASRRDVSEIESRDSIREEDGTDGEEAVVERGRLREGESEKKDDGEGLGKTGKAQHVKFEGDQEKGATADEGMTGESVDD